MENVQWEDLKANGKTEMDICNIAYEVEKLIAAVLKLGQFSQNL